MSSLFHGIRWKFVTLVGVLLFALLGSLYQTYLIVHNRQADAVIIDLAGRQRMLSVQRKTLDDPLVHKQERATDDLRCRAGHDLV